MKSYIFSFLLCALPTVSNFAQSSDELAVAAWAKGDVEKAEHYFLASCKNLNDSLRLSPLLSEKVMIGHRKSFQKSFDRLFSFIEKNPSDKLLGRVYDNILLFHNASMDRAVTLRQKIQYTDEKTRQMFQTRDSLLTLLGRQYELPFISRINTTELEQKAEDVEMGLIKRLKTGKAHFRALSVELVHQQYINKPTLRAWLCYLKIKARKGNQKLADQIYDYAAKMERGILRWQQVRNELKQNETAIEFVAYRSQIPNEATDIIRYGALVLKKGDNAPRFVALCTQAQLGILLQKNINNEYYWQYLYAPRKNNNSSSLYSLIGQPLEPLLKGTQKIYYAPAGDLHRVNIAALSPSEDIAPLSQNIEFILINSARSLMNVAENSEGNRAAVPTIQLPCKKQGTANMAMVHDLLGNIEFDYYGSVKTRDAVLFGNVYYDMDSLSIKNGINKATKTNENPHPKKTLIKRDFDERKEKGDWEALTGTKEEVGSIKKIFTQADYKVTVHEGYAASEEAFKALGKRKTSPRILHIATHGYFFSDTTLLKNDNPLNCSGLILAGANHAWKTGKPILGLEDGLVTAFEIGQMNLQNTELVVLSACETGLGYIENNEGVFGLQRAFKRAGVQNLMVSLWSVPDKATQELMTQFYKNCLEKNMTLRVALKEAQKWMREQENYKNPYFWAAFVLLE